jgi:arylformamidase
MIYLDITRTISNGMKKYPSDPAVTVKEFKSFKKGNSCNLYRLSFGSHTGTHIDAPRHIFDKGSTLDDITIDNLICNIVVSYRKDFFKKIGQKKVKGVLFKKEGCRGLSVKEAMVLIDNGIRVVGAEAMSIESSSDKSHPVHRLLLGNGIIIIEGLSLGGVKPGYYKLICLPLKIKDSDGAPARAVLAYD